MMRRRVVLHSPQRVDSVSAHVPLHSHRGDNKYLSNYRFLIAAGTQARYLVKSCDWLLQKDRRACKTRKVLGWPYALTPHRSLMSQCATLSHLWNSETSSIHRGPTASCAQTFLLSPSGLELERPVESSIWLFGATGTVTCRVPDEFPTATGCNLQPPVEIKGPISTLSSGPSSTLPLVVFERATCGGHL